MTQHISATLLDTFEEFSPSNPAVVRLTTKNATNSLTRPIVQLGDLNTNHQATIKMSPNKETNTKVFMKPNHEMKGFAQDIEVVITGHTL